jgi:hypothetical protein
LSHVLIIGNNANNDTPVKANPMINQTENPSLITGSRTALSGLLGL